MDEKDKEIQELRRENARLTKELQEAVTMQFKLFKLVPAEKLVTLLKEVRSDS